MSELLVRPWDPITCENGHAHWLSIQPIYGGQIVDTLKLVCLGGAKPIKDLSRHRLCSICGGHLFAPGNNLYVRGKPIGVHNEKERV